MITLKRQGLTLAFKDLTDLIPARGSSDVPIGLEQDETYTDYIPEIHCGYMAQDGSVKEILLGQSDDHWLIPAEVFARAQIAYLAVALVKDNEVQVTSRVSCVVQPAPHGTVLLPSESTWEKLVEDYVDKFLGDYTAGTIDPLKDEMEGMRDEAKASQDAAEQAAGTASGQATKAEEAADRATDQAAAADASAGKAKESETQAGDYAKLSQSWAVGGTDSRAGEDTDNAMYYASQAKADATDAKGSATQAASEASTAAEQAKAAEGSAQNARESETRAAASESNAQEAANRLEELVGGNLATATHWDISLTANDWQAASGETFAGLTAAFKVSKPCEGMTEATDISGIVFTGGDRTAAAAWSWLAPGVDSVTLYAIKKPAADFSLRLVEVK